MVHNTTCDPVTVGSTVVHGFLVHDQFITLCHARAGGGYGTYVNSLQTLCCNVLATIQRPIQASNAMVTTTIRLLFDGSSTAVRLLVKSH